MPLSANLANIFTRPSSKNRFDVWHCAATPASRSCTGTCSIPHQLERCPNRIQDSPWIFQWDFQKNFHGFAPSLWCFDNCTSWQVTTATFEFVASFGNCSSPDQSFGIAIFDIRHPPSRSWSAAPAATQVAQTVLESTGVEPKGDPSGYRPHDTKPTPRNGQKHSEMGALKMFERL